MTKEFLKIVRFGKVAGKLQIWQLKELFQYARDNDVSKRGDFDARMAINYWAEMDGREMARWTRSSTEGWKSVEAI